MEVRRSHCRYKYSQLVFERHTQYPLPLYKPKLSLQFISLCNHICMAANLQRNRGLANLGKRLARQIRSRDSLAISLLHRRIFSLVGVEFEYDHQFICTMHVYNRSVQASAYEKNPEENVNSTLVPDHVIPPQSDEYWAPHPKTGVFGPATDENPGLGRNPGGEGGTDGGSVLEEKAFFRPLKDLEKPPVQPSSLESHN
ncbi:hypothetical protein SASPL_135143 [Salvia splendens]|uniref:Uncharacterized protein n=1 Tax=Salvia splendens TaxID=180675 RepID=A0A8X8ZGC5_SALSN|nr:hypothetical protein SASPL_135143 [Salvia splendens]